MTGGGRLVPLSNGEGPGRARWPPSDGDIPPPGGGDVPNAMFQVGRWVRSEIFGLILLISSGCLMRTLL